ncbi:MAG: thiamine phosphate synthase [Dyadobacter sp.]|uniref:thiamine phosphate synthase n=1 Tax=Dyadobacter sp. TaxID=1914288 RepID=UPI001B2E239F|nr:thiamine phosphate synthase [Dyadobacter sp.]MBO9611930.1 thiamine phosphate synthase [Dyadobacter sp.]
MKELIVITHPKMLPGEAGMINQLFTHGLMRLHVRKPEASEAQFRALLEGIHPQFRGRIALHQYHALAKDFGITGLHFTESNRLAQSEETFEELKNNGFIISTSLHDPADLETLSHGVAYAFLGPVFDSISKEGYRSKLPDNFRLEKYGFPNSVIALGGIHAENLKSALEMGFDGAAVLGSIWQNPDNAIAQFELLKSLQTSPSHPAFQQTSSIPGLKPGARDLASDDEFLSLQSFPSHPAFQQTSSIPGLKPGARDSKIDLNEKAIHCPRFQPRDPELGIDEIAAVVDKLHFISNETSNMSHIDSIRLALEAGCRWIQLRVKNRPEQELLPIAREATRLCDSYGAKLIINDFPRIALAVEAYGVHLGLADMPVPDARALVGKKMIIGGTANTWEDIVRRIDEGADYIGLGPFRFTATKQNLSPILGIEGYRQLMRRMKAAGHSTPIIAIGGITADDIAAIRATGIHGVAMSGALITAADPQKTFYQIQQALC